MKKTYFSTINVAPPPQVPENHLAFFKKRIDTRPLLAFMLAMMFGGIFPIISQVNRFALWGLWVIIWWLVYLAPKPSKLRNLITPAIPFVIWLFVYGIYGSAASPVNVIGQFGTDFFRMTTLLAAFAVLISDRASLRMLGNIAPLILFLNLLVSIALQQNTPLADFLVQNEFAHADIQLATDRYSGLWGNANVAGMNTLILLILTVWGRGKLLWIGRVAGVWIIYLTASRTSAYLLVLICIYFLYTSFKYIPKFRVLIAVAAFIVILVWIAGSLPAVNQLFPEGSTVQRLLDITESDVARGTRRLDVIEEWLPYLESELWYGRGYGAMGGAGSMGVIYRTDVPYIGIHNMYLGSAVDAGVLGALSYLIMLAIGLKRAVRSHLAPIDRTATLALWGVALIFSAFAHNLQASMDGQSMYLLCFLLPKAMALFESPANKVRPSNRQP